MKKSLRLKNITLCTATAIVCLFSNIVSADCDSTADLHYPGIEPPNYYGNAKTDSFNCAINGNKQLTLEQINERAELLPPSLDNKFYVMLGVNTAAEGLQRLSLHSNGIAPSQTGMLSETQTKVASNNFEIAVGYAWKDFALDLEWLAVKSITYNGTMNNTAPTASFTFSTTVQGDSVLGNIYWFFNDMYNAKIYGVLNLSYSRNQSFTYIETGDINEMNRYYIGGGLGIGARFNVISSLYADIVGRALYLGNVRISAINGASAVDLDAKRTWLGASLRLLWLI